MIINPIKRYLFGTHRPYDTGLKRNRLLFPFNTIAFFAAIVCFLAVHASATTIDVVDRIVAVINDDIISLYELNTAIAPFKDKIDDAGYAPDESEQLYNKLAADILQKLIEKKLFDQEVRRLGLFVSDGAVEATLDRMKNAGNMTDEAFERTLTQEGSSIYEYREQIREQLLRNQLVNYEVKSRVVITEDAIAEY